MIPFGITRPCFASPKTASPPCWPPMPMTRPATRFQQPATREGVGHAVAHPHVAEVNQVVERLAAGHDRAHQHIGATAGVFGQRLRRDVDAQVKGVEGNACAPGVVQRRDDALRVAVVAALGISQDSSR